MTVTRKDIANHTGFSLSTVGMILSGRHERYSVETRKKVMQAAKELNYSPDMAARSLKLNRSFLIGVLVDVRNACMAVDFLRGVQAGLTGSDYSPAVFMHDTSEAQYEGMRRLIGRRVDGLITNVALEPDGSVDRRRYDALRQRGLPIVEVFGRFLPDVSSVNIDNVSAAYTSVVSLLKRGHRRIAHLTHSGYRASQEQYGGKHFDAWEYYLGYDLAMREAGEETVVITHSITREIDVEEEFISGAEMEFDTIVSHSSSPTAVVCYNDYEAYGLVRAARMRGVSLPERLSVVGCGDLEISKITSPTITSVRLPTQEIGRKAVQMLLRQGKESSVERLAIPCELVDRESVQSVVG